MATNDGFRKYIEAGAVLGRITRARAEELVQELVNAGEVQRGQASQWVDDLIDLGRKTSEQLVEVVRREVGAQLAALGFNSVEDLAQQVADVLHRSAEAGRGATSTAAGGAARAARAATGRTKKPKKKAAAKTAAAKKAPAKKAASKKAAPKKAAAKKKAPAKKAAAKKAH